MLQTNFKIKIANQVEDIPVKAIQSFIHLFDDSDQDFEEELTLENLRQLVVKKVRENNNAEQMLNELDIKIALLVKNRITLEEVIKTSKRPQQQLAQSNQIGSQANLFAGAGNFKAVDRETRYRLELYQNLFYILQTQSKYFARLIFLIKQSKIRNFMNHVLLSTFNFANSPREEFLLLNLFQRAIKNEMGSATDIGDFLRGNPVLIQMVVYYNRYVPLLVIAFRLIIYCI
jgi:Ras GTPase-activating-like protein IQGAP2/3